LSYFPYHSPCATDYVFVILHFTTQTTKAEYFSSSEGILGHPL
jgi:hypothetical protein